MGHKIKSDVIAAVEGFVADVNENVPGVRVELKGKFDSGRNAVLPYKAPTLGSRLVLSFGDGADGGTVTNYALHVPLLASRNASARSLRLTPEKGHGAVMAVSSRPQEGRERVETDLLSGELLERSYALAANSMSFAGLFEDGHEHLVVGSREGDGFMRCLDMLGDDAGDAQAMREGLDKLRFIAKGGAAGGMDGRDPVDRMAAWTVYSGMGVLNERQAARAAASVLGLDALKEALKEAGARAAAGDPPGLEEILDPDTEQGRMALCGLATLGYYKAVMNYGGDYGIRRDGTVGRVGTADRNESVFLRGANARREAESRRNDEIGDAAGMTGLAPYYCYQKMMGGGTSAGGNKVAPSGKAPADQRVDLNMMYRFYRCAMLEGEDPDGRSSTPLAQLTYRGDISSGKASRREIYVDVPGVPADRMRTLPDELALLANDLTSGQAPQSRLHGFPAMERLLRTQGPDAILKMAEKLVEADFSTGPDVLELELEAFLDDKGAEGRRTGNRPSARQMYDVCNKAAEERLGGMRAYRYSRDNAIGLPDCAHGLTAFGELYQSESEAAMSGTPVLLGPLDEVSGWSDPRRQKGNGRAAGSFRDMDLERAVMAALSCREPFQPWHEALQASGLSAAADAYAAALDRFGSDGNPTAAAMKVNDLMVLTEAYRPAGADEMQALVDDVESAYGTPGPGVYRPRNPGELKVLRAASMGRGEMPVTSPREQGTAAGFGRTVDALVGGDAGMRRNIENIFRAEALEKDTFSDRTYTELADAVSPERNSAPGKEPVRQTVLKALMDMKDETDEREAGGQEEETKDVPV